MLNQLNSVFEQSFNVAKRLLTKSTSSSIVFLSLLKRDRYRGVLYNVKLFRISKINAFRNKLNNVF